MADYKDLLSTILSDRINKFSYSPNTKPLVDALGASAKDSGVFGMFNTSDLLGLGPEDIYEIAKTRGDLSYKKIMSDLGALEFANKAIGVDAMRELANKMITEEQENANRLALAKEQGRWHVAAAQSGDPVRAFIADSLRKASSGNKLSKTEWGMVNKTVGGLSPDDAAEVVKQIPLLMSVYSKDKETLSNIKSLLKTATSVIENYNISNEEENHAKNSSSNYTSSLPKTPEEAKDAGWRLTTIKGEAWYISPDRKYKIRASKQNVGD